MSGVGTTAEQEATFRMNPFLRSAIWPRTMMHMRVTETTLQLTTRWAKPDESGICIIPMTKPFNFVIKDYSVPITLAVKDK